MLTTNIAIRKNKKFTTAAIGCFLRLPLTKHNLAYASLLARIQMNSSLSYPSLALQQKDWQNYMIYSWRLCHKFLVKKYF